MIALAAVGCKSLLASAPVPTRDTIRLRGLVSVISSPRRLTPKQHQRQRQHHWTEPSDRDRHGGDHVPTKTGVKPNRCSYGGENHGQAQDSARDSMARL